MGFDAAFLGRAIAFPLAVDGTGRVAFLRGEDAIEASITIVLSTARGERVMRPEFGCAIWDQLFEPINENTLGLMEDAARQALSQWEPRIEVEDVRAQPTMAGSPMADADGWRPQGMLVAPGVEMVDLFDAIRGASSPELAGRVDIEIDYRIRDTNDRRNLVYPFYTLGEEGQ